MAGGVSLGEERMSALRASLLMGLALAGCRAGPPCLPLSPECARAEADLQVRVTDIPDDATRVRSTVADQDRQTSQFPDRTAVFFFYDLPEDGVDVTVEVEGARSTRCQAMGVGTGRGRAVEIRVGQDGCRALTAADAGADRDGGTDAGGGAVDGGPGDGGRSDAGERDDGGGGDRDGGARPDDAGVRDGGAIRLVILSETRAAALADGGSVRTEVLGAGTIILTEAGRSSGSVALEADDLAEVSQAALDPELTALLRADDHPCAEDLPGVQVRLVTSQDDRERDLAGCTHPAWRRLSERAASFSALSHRR